MKFNITSTITIEAKSLDEANERLEWAYSHVNDEIRAGLCENAELDPNEIDNN